MNPEDIGVSDYVGPSFQNTERTPGILDNQDEEPRTSYRWKQEQLSSEDYHERPVSKNPSDPTSSWVMGLWGFGFSLILLTGFYFYWISHAQALDENEETNLTLDYALGNIEDGDDDQKTEEVIEAPILPETAMEQEENIKVEKK